MGEKAGWGSWGSMGEPFTVYSFRIYRVSGQSAVDSRRTYMDSNTERVINRFVADGAVEGKYLIVRDSGDGRFFEAVRPKPALSWSWCEA